MRTTEEIAMICHEVNRGLCQGIGDFSQPAWEDAPDWQKDSARNGVNAVMEGKVVNPEDSHQNWATEKIAAGWKYGDVKDPEKKEHPCLVDFHELPADQQLKDALFLTVVEYLK